MQYTVPHYYKKFRCIAGECPDTCCAGWQIQIDPASLRKYRKIKGPLGNRLKNEINWKESCFRQYNGRCAFLNENDLCDLYLEGGGTRAFCRTCRTYPRHIEEFEGLREISLSLSCPAAADLILNCGEPVRFLHAEDEKEDEPYEDFDFFLYTKLEDARSLILRILQDRAHPFSLRAAASLALAHDLQQRIDKNALFEADSLFDRYSSPGMWTWFEARFSALELSEDHTEKRNSTENALFSILDRLEVLRDDWMPYLVDARRTLKNAPALQKEEERSFSDLFTEQTAEQLLVYFVFTYFCGAVYNADAYGKMKFSFAGMILIRELVRAEWIRNPDITGETLLRTAWRYAREVEHADKNKFLMEELLADEERFGLEDLFSLLLP